jgi:hypothetical protein
MADRCRVNPIFSPVFGWLAFQAFVKCLLEPDQQQAIFFGYLVNFGLIMGKNPAKIVTLTFFYQKWFDQDHLRLSPVMGQLDEPPIVFFKIL